MANINGNNSNNTLTGTASADQITGQGGNDNLTGLGGNDRLTGGTGNDTMTGGAGNDLMIGGAGNDIYIIDGGGEINKSTVDAGIDTVRSTVGYTLGGHQENLTLLGTGNIAGTGNALNNIILGTTGNNTLTGLGGNDTLTGNNGNDTLTDAAGNDTLNGGAGNDTLVGGAGNDRLLGGTGNDTLTYDVADTRGVDGGAGGTDILKISGTTTANFVTLNATTDRFLNIEVIDLSATGAQTVVLDEATVLGALTDTDTLRIKGTSVDAVQASGVWTPGADVIDGSITYKVFESGDATLEVQSGVKTTGIAQAPVITSNGGAATGNVSIGENGTGVTAVTATDANPGTTFAYAISGGADAALFLIDPDSGVLTFITARDFETPADTDTNNVYEVVVNVSDGEVSDSQTLNVTVTNINEAPTVTGDLGASANEGGNVVLTITDLSGNDPDDSGTGLVFTVTNVTDNGTLFRDGNVLTLNATFTAADLAGGLVIYQHGGGESTTDAFGFSLADGGENGAASDTDTFNFTITAVNDTPVIAGDLAATLNEGATYTLTTTDLGESDPDDSGAGLTYTVTNVTDNGALKLNGTTLNLNDTFTAADVAGSLVTYEHNGGETTSDGFAFSLADGGENGVGSDSDNFTFTISAVNDAPVNTVPGAQSVNMFQNVTIAGISVADSDVATSSLQITLSANLGATLSLSGTTGLSFTSGNGVDDASMVFTGTLTNVNTALNNLVFHGAAAGTATITLLTGDQGNTGSGGAASDSDTITVNVAPVVLLSGLNGANGFRLEGIDAYDESGVAVAGAGDVNGDGFADFIVGAFFADPGGVSRAGESYVVFGKGTAFASSLDLAALNGTNGFRLDGIDDNDRSGLSVAGAGDVNGDGIADIVVGAFFADPNSDVDAGESYVVFGSDTGFTSALNLADLNGTNGFRLDGVDANDKTGRSVNGAGDVNGDGIGDLIIGANEATAGADFAAGKVYVVFGSGGGFASSVDLAALNGANGFRLDGIDPSDRAGTSVADAGDVNGDGIADLIVGASGGTGKAYVVFGKLTGFASSLDLATLNGSNGFLLNGAASGDNTGYSVASAGDVNGDGLGDVIIGAHFADVSGNASGSSYVVFGSATPASILNLGALNGSNGFRLDGVTSDDHAGQSVSSAGDVNGDGFDDLLIGASHRTAGVVAQAGETYLVFGKAGGYTSDLDLSALNGTNGFVLRGIDTSDYSGKSVSAAGDVNGDGFDDLIVGAYFGDPGNDQYAGESYIVFGGDFRKEAFLVGGTGNDTLNGNASANIIVGGDGNDGITGAAGNDSLQGGAGADTLDGENDNDVLDGGSGADTLTGSSGNDRLIGGDGGDTLNGGVGVDLLVGGAGDDTLDGGAGNDRLIDGDSGFDTLDFSAATQSTSIDLSLDKITSDGFGGVVNEMVRGIEAIIGGSFNDTMIGDDGDNSFSGGGGSDIFFGGRGADTLSLGFEDEDPDQVFFNDFDEGAAPGSNEGFDSIQEFNAFYGDQILFNDNAQTALDDIDTNGFFEIAEDSAPDFDNDHEALLRTGLIDADLVEDGFATLITNLNTLGLTAANGADGLILVQGDTQTGIYYYLENGGDANDIEADELTLLATVDAQLQTVDVFFGGG